MDASELDRRARTNDGWIPTHLVSYLLEHGHLDEVQDQARGGDWLCAEGWARFLGDQDRRDDALRVLAPYVETGWWTAARSVAILLDEWGRADEAITLVRPYAEAGERPALGHFALLLARNGRGEEAYALLRPHIEDWLLADALVEVTAGLGRDEEVAALLAARIKAGRRCDGPSCGRRTLRPDNAVDLLATVRERQGHVDEAIALLRTREITSVNNRDQLADLLARHERIDELREYAATEDLGDATRCLAELLEERGDVAGAVDAYRPRIDDGWPQAAVELAKLLARHGRGDEAIEVLRSALSSMGDEDWVVDALYTQYLDQGRAEEGLEYLDKLKARVGTEEWDTFFRFRTRLLVSCGRREQAIEEARARFHPESWFAAPDLAEMLSDAGRPEEAIAVLNPTIPSHRNVLAAHLMKLGRITDAVAVLKLPNPSHVPPWSPEVAAWDHTRSWSTALALHELPPF